MMEPILAMRLAKKGLTSMQIGLFFTIFPVFHIVSCLTAQHISKKFEKRMRIIGAASLNAIAFFLIGPSLLLGMSDSLILMGIG